VGGGTASWAGPRRGLAERRMGRTSEPHGPCGWAGGEREDGVVWAASVGQGWPAGLKV
jgi:hypothetical protein